MELRYLLAVVTSVGSEPGGAVALALGRAGAAVLVADPDHDAAERTARQVAAARVRAWSWQADLAQEPDVRLLAARARDLGGADLVVLPAAGPAERAGADLLDHLLAEVAEVAGCDDPAANGRRAVGTPALVHLRADDAGPARARHPGAGGRSASVLGAVAGDDGSLAPASPAASARAVTTLLRTGHGGEVVDLRRPTVDP